MLLQWHDGSHKLASDGMEDGPGHSHKSHRHDEVSAEIIFRGV